MQNDRYATHDAQTFPHSDLRSEIRAVHGLNSKSLSNPIGRIFGILYPSLARGLLRSAWMIHRVAFSISQLLP